MAPERRAMLGRMAASLGRGVWPATTGGRLLAVMDDVPGLRRLARSLVHRRAVTSMFGEVATPADALEALRDANSVHDVGWPQHQGPVLALGRLGTMVREAGGRAEPRTPEQALLLLREALRKGSTILVWSVGPPYVAMVTAHTVALPMGLGMYRALGAPVRPGPRRPYIDKNLCDLCTECVRACPINRLLHKGSDIVLKAHCAGCGLCEGSCPEAAITMVVPAARPGMAVTASAPPDG